MRKNHHGKKDRLVKRVFALCLALAVICTCLVPVFATEYKEVVDSGNEEVAGFGGDEAAGFGDDFPAVDDGEPREVYDEGEAAGFGGDEVATRPAEGEGGEDNLDGGPNVKETEWGTVIEYDTSSSTVTHEDDVVAKPDDKVVVSGDEIKKLQDMVVYRFWLKELNANDLQDITAQAQINNMTESEYLARNGEVLWKLYFIQAVPRAETIADYSSCIENPSSNRDPEGKLRLFDYWYTLDEFGNRVRLNLTDPTSNILDDKTTTVNVYAAWKDGTVGSDEEKPVDHEDLVDKNPVPVDLTAKASASYEDEDGNTKSANLPVEVKNLPSAAHSLSVIHMGDDDMQTFYESHSNAFEGMAPILGLKISPKNAKGEKVQPAKGEKAAVTVSGLDKLPAMEGATADTLKVLHETSDGNVEILDVLTYTNGTLTFETTSFSPFVVVRTDGYDSELLDERASDEYVPLYLYALKPGLEWQGNSTKNNNNWYGIGIAKIKPKCYKKETTDSTDIQNKISNNDILLEPFSGDHWYVGVQKHYTGKKLYPKIGMDKMSVVDADKPGYTYWDKNGNMPTSPYYTVEWFHLTKEWGAPASDNGYNTPAVSIAYSTYHLDARITFSDMCNVDFMVKEPGKTDFERLDVRTYSAAYTKGTSESKVIKPQDHGYNVNQHSGYVFDGWYKDKACTIKAEFDGTIVKDTTYYGKYVLKDTIEEDIPYITVEKQITGIGVKQIPANFYVKVGDQMLEYQSATIVKEADPIILRWTILNPTPQTYFITEGHETVKGYTVTRGGAIDKDVDVTKATFEVTVDKIIHECSNLTLNIGQHDEKEFLFVVSANGNQSKNIVISKLPLSLTQREAVEAKLKSTKGAFGNQNEETVYYSIKDKEKVVIDHVELTYSESAGTITINGKNVWNMAMQLSYKVTEGNNPEVKITNDYTLATANVTITKQVTGLMGDTHKDFTFSIAGLDDSDAMLENGNLSNFTLTHNGSVTLKNVPMDTVFAVVETLGADSGYETKATGHDTDATRTFYYKLVLEDGEQKLMACDADGSNEMEQDGMAITVTNHCTHKPDTGVLLDTLPYIVILAVVAGGGILLMLRKRRKEDD
ncbi:InlB B-repeat-containing protein [Faecalibacterium prausnitzii]|uniref:InlB B-repeat-containing protein n=1 Tax=Faecalibacterium prausnitzii TaxID=853 RepID=UPI0012DF3C51|nr:InlB B-repeat-containing protein [Faecalibacterium prausnitzii]